MKSSSHPKNSQNDALVDHLIHNKVIKSQIVNDVMRKVDRGEFCDSPNAYKDCP